ncbi:FAD binding domain-containing protein [Triangularia verruculosa]|uniref:FAD binding domain-containing protein n=1 Tax=Triangularia verruculosa TaxID=2587418 RepID=A0AAN7AU66_9PEZI|nr:FAD binding domain-containing protein [Triangularia verruculosa]
MSPSPSTTVDLLIVGAGPAGLALANWFRDTDITVLLVDKKPGPTPRGQAEGLKSTTNEIFDSYGIGPQITAESWRLEEIACWGMRKDGAEGIVREQVIPDRVEELGKPRETMLQQSRVEHHMLQNILPHNNIEIRYNTIPVAVEVDIACGHEADAYPVTVWLKKVNNDATTLNGHATNGINGHESNGQMNNDQNGHYTNGTDTNEDHTFKERVSAKYIVGCDGARSWLRKQLNVILEGDLTDSVFGVVDMVPKSNFPDIRRVCYLRAASGTILLVPRSNREVRMYIPVESGTALPDPKDLTFDRIMDATRKIIAPYTMDVGSVSWWSAYRVRQRVGNYFSRLNERAFLVGDTVHTHSPKAGQGMNTSIQDAYNLGWKLRLALEGQVRSPSARQDLLRTYESERRPVALDLIAFDKGFLKLFAAPSARFDTEILQALKFTTGLSIRYPPSCAVQLPKGVEQLGPSLLKADLVPGKRLPDFRAVYQADGVPTWMHKRLSATGQFRVVIFAGDITDPARLERLLVVGRYLGENESLKHLTMTRPGKQPLVEVLVVHCADRDQVDFLALPEVYRPWSEESGYDYCRVFADVESVHDGHGRAYERLEIDPAVGCMVVVRPDGYIGAVLDVDDVDGVRTYFERNSL